MAGAESSWELSRVTFNGFVRRMSKVVAEAQSLGALSFTAWQMDRKLTSSCPDDQTRSVGRAVR